ncbi:MAG: HvfC/BufC family peptide modification chaperone [Candidatus Binataceae bacterium]
MPLALKNTQSLLYRLIAAPGGVEEGLAHERGLPRGGLGAVIRGDSRMSAAERLDIYANMYFHRLLEVLTEDFPALSAALGADNFHNLVTGYLTEYPPTEASVFWTGKYLAEYLRTHPLRREFPYAADLAELERAIVEVFCARDVAPLGADAMRAIAPERWPSMRMRAITALRVIELEWRIAPALRAFGNRHKWKPPARGASTIVVWRSDAKVFYRGLDSAEAGAVAKLKRGAAFGAICAGVSRAIARQNSARDPVAAINAMLARWLRDGIVAGARLDRGDAKLSPARPRRAAPT